MDTLNYLAFRTQLARTLDKVNDPIREPVVNLVSVQVGFLISEVVKIATGITEPKSAGRMIEFDFASMSTSIVEKWDRRPDCSACGDGHARQD